MAPRRRDSEGPISMTSEVRRLGAKVTVHLTSSNTWPKAGRRARGPLRGPPALLVYRHPAPRLFHERALLRSHSTALVREQQSPCEQEIQHLNRRSAEIYRSRPAPAHAYLINLAPKHGSCNHADLSQIGNVCLQFTLAHASVCATRCIAANAAQHWSDRLGLGQCHHVE